MLDINTSIRMIRIVPWFCSGWRLYVWWFQRKFVAMCLLVATFLSSCNNIYCFNKCFYFIKGFYIVVATITSLSLHKDLQLLRHGGEGNLDIILQHLQFFSLFPPFFSRSISTSINSISYSTLVHPLFQSTPPTHQNKGKAWGKNYMKVFDLLKV